MNQSAPENEPYFSDFTESQYEELLGMATRGWRLISFPEYKQPGKVCLWRHDLDFSAHRALRLAEIEADHGVKATYFLHLHSEFYNCLESEVAARIRRIRDLGHHLGLHFDPHISRLQGGTQEDLEGLLHVEQAVLERFFATRIETFSIHNPDSDLPAWLQQDQVAGMINASGGSCRIRYSYVSDSNGYWRFRRLRDVLECGAEERLHVLTHPEWWTPTPMSPRARVTRCIEGRARKQHEWYDALLAMAARKNIT